MAKGWTEERRRKQAENIRKTKPWEKSTGPKTEKGKERCRYNALKHGRRSIFSGQINLVLKANRDFLNQVNFYIESEQKLACLLAALNTKQSEGK